jgi:type I restriction enzyme S subunit
MTMQDVMAEFYDGPHATPPPASEGPIYLGIKNMTQDGHLDLSEVRHISISEYSRWTRRVEPRAGDVIFTYEASLHRYAIIPEGFRGTLGRRVALLRPRTDVVDTRFLLYLFISPQWRSTVQARLNAGSTVDRLPLTDFPRFPLRIPSLATQRKIAGILSAYDDLIDNNNRRIEVLEEMAQRIYAEWFVDLRYPGYHDVPLKDSELGPIPEDWSVRQLSELTATQYGYTESASSEPVGPRFLRGMDINKSSYIDWSTVPYCPITVDNYAKYRLAPGDVVIIRMADPGKVGVVEVDIDAVFASYLVRIQPRDDLLKPYFLFYFLSSERYQGFVSGASTGTTRKSLSAPLITSIRFALPPVATQKAFSEAVGVLRAQLNALLLSNSNLRTTRDLLLPKLISGEIDVADLDVAVPDLAA